MSCRNPDITDGAGAVSFFDRVEKSPTFQAFDSKPVMLFIAITTLIVATLGYMKKGK